MGDFDAEATQVTPAAEVVLEGVAAEVWALEAVAAEVVQEATALRASHWGGLVATASPLPYWSQELDCP